MIQYNPLLHFRGAERLNCAQAVLKTFDTAAGIGPGCIERFLKLGSGRAPAGECGALFAAKAMLTDARSREAVEARFIAAGGATQCRTIRQRGSLSCQQCVQLAADELAVRLRAGEVLARPAQCSE